MGLLATLDNAWFTAQMGARVVCERIETGRIGGWELQGWGLGPIVEGAAPPGLPA